MRLNYMFMGDEREEVMLTFLRTMKERRELCSTLVPRQSTGEWACRRLWLREIGLEFVDLIVNPDNEPALTGMIESWSKWRAMNGGSRMIIENSPVGSSKSIGIVERAIQSVQSVIRTIRSTIEEKWEGQDRRDAFRVPLDRRAARVLDTEA